MPEETSQKHSSSSWISTPPTIRSRSCPLHLWSEPSISDLCGSGFTLYYHLSQHAECHRHHHHPSNLHHLGFSAPQTSSTIQIHIRVCNSFVKSGNATIGCGCCPSFSPLWILGIMTHFGCITSTESQWHLICTGRTLDRSTSRTPFSELPSKLRKAGPWNNKGW